MVRVKALEPFHLKAVIEAAHTAIVSIDLSGRIVTFNSAAEKITGVSSKNAIGRYCEEILLTDGLTRVALSGSPETGIKVTIGDTSVLTSRSPIVINGKIAGAVAVFQDITDIEQMSAELASVKDLNIELDAIIESVSDGLYITDGKGNTLRVNSAYERISGGVKAEEVIGKNMKELVDEGYYSKSVTFIVLEKKEPVSILHTIKGDKEALITGTPVFDEKGSIVRVVTTVRDMDELNTIKKELARSIEESNKYKRELEKLREEKFVKNEIVMHSRAMAKVMDLAVKMGEVRSTILITGESGVGKEIIAKTIHNSGNPKTPFIKVNCGAIPENLLESELFGYEEGAFTGACKGGKKGLFEAADKGTVFLDEIGELSLNLQVKLLRCIQEKEIYRVGGVSPLSLDVRIIAATNRDLEEMVVKGSFRQDLFYRLSVIPINVPPLRERKEDIVPLVYSFLKKFCNEFNIRKEVCTKALKALESYSWPGNVRELENHIERLTILASGPVIQIDDLSEKITSQYDADDLFNISVPESASLDEILSKVEEIVISKSLKKHKTTRKAAAALGISQSSVVRKTGKYKR